MMNPKGQYIVIGRFSDLRDDFFKMLRSISDVDKIAQKSTKPSKTKGA
jgi:hypothetical protein